MNNDLHIDMCDREEEMIYNFLLVAKLENEHHELTESTDLFDLRNKAVTRYTNNEKLIGGFIYQNEHPIYRMVNFRGRIDFLPVEDNSLYFQEAIDTLFNERAFNSLITD